MDHFRYWQLMKSETHSVHIHDHKTLDTFKQWFIHNDVVSSCIHYIIIYLIKRCDMLQHVATRCNALQR